MMSEALTRAQPVDDAERAALVALFTDIERGAITGAVVGVESEDEREAEEEG